MFEELDNLTFLWSTVRNVSHFLRAYVDEFFRRCVLPNTFIDLHYSDIHTRHGPVHNYIHVPMVFDRLTDDGSRAVFQQRAYKKIDQCHLPGSVHGWIPFIERYHNEVLKDKPQVLNRSKPDNAPPLWEREYMRWRQNLFDGRKKSYLLNMGNMTSIARGDRPPFYIKVHGVVNDTDMVHLVIDCKQREISFNWRQTLALFYLEQNFAARAYNNPGKRVYDKDLERVAGRYFRNQNRYNHALRARQKRLLTWTAKNKQRMSPEVRLWTEHRVDAEKVRLQRSLNHKNLTPVSETANDEDEIVPNQLADDHADLMFWPWVDDDGFFVPVKNARVVHLNCCAVL